MHNSDKELENRIRISESDEALMREAIIKEVVNRPPTIGLIGVSGVGKSSTINAMFNTRLEVSHVVACTKEFRDVDLKVKMNAGAAAGQNTVLRVIDAPGLGEDILRDPTYLEMYKRNLGRCDVILWVLTARNRAVALDQMYLQQLLSFSKRMVFGINQVDLVEPLNWNKKINLPSYQQEQNIEIILEDRKQRIESVFGRRIQMIPYSANQKYQLQKLFTTMIEASPQNRAWIFSALKSFKPEDFLPEDARDEVIRLLKKKNSRKRKKKKRGWFGS